MKYYVFSGDLQVVIERESREFAALDVLDSFTNAERDLDIDGTVRVNETGFEAKQGDTVFNTSELFMAISGEIEDDDGNS